MPISQSNRLQLVDEQGQRHHDGLDATGRGAIDGVLRVQSLMLSGAGQQCALNRYQMALVAAHGGGILEPAASERHAYRPLYQDVAYSQRFQLMPGACDQLFMAHNPELLLIAIRDPRPATTFFGDGDLEPVPFEEGQGRVQRGFYHAAKRLYERVSTCLNNDFGGHKVLMCGHGASGAIALILGQMLRHRDVQLYTYGAPRAGDAAFVRASQSLAHYRMVHHHDLLPSLPGSWMTTRLSTYHGHATQRFNHTPPELGVFVAGLSALTGELYQHHGALCHFMPLASGLEGSHLVWAPTSDIVTQHALSLLVFERLRDRPECDGMVGIGLGESLGVDSYVASSWVALQRSQVALEAREPEVTEALIKAVDLAFEHIAQQLRRRYQAVVSQVDADRHEQERMINLLMRELSRLHITRQRLYDMRFKVPCVDEVYGDCTQQS
ncbi:lipase family protein [Pseudomonas helleri]|uniref:lipase family protein n=1 Tax=Pseudomonas helleri TaxID=1608996 RepID=UPI0024326540|nr:lipase family protein [Pseudomonas helleri]